MVKNSPTSQRDFRRLVEGYERECAAALLHTNPVDHTLIHWLLWKIESSDFYAGFPFKSFPDPPVEKAKYRDQAKLFRQLTRVVQGKEPLTPLLNILLLWARTMAALDPTDPRYHEYAASALAKRTAALTALRGQKG